MDRRSGRREVRRDMMLKAVLADVAQQLLHLRNLNHASAAKGIQRIVGKRTLADIAG